VGKHKKPSVEELHLLLWAANCADQKRADAISAETCVALGQNPPEKPPATLAMEKNFAKNLTLLVAQRLWRNRRSVPMISRRDVRKMGADIIEQIIASDADLRSLDAEDKALLRSTFKAVVGNLTDVAAASLPGGKNAYTAAWKWVRTAMRMTEEFGVTPDQLMGTEQLRDELTRRAYTRKRFVAERMRLGKAIMDADKLIGAISGPILRMAGEDKELRALMETQIEKELKPKIKIAVEKVQEILSQKITEETERIYGKE